MHLILAYASSRPAQEALAVGLEEVDLNGFGRAITRMSR